MKLRNVFSVLTISFAISACTLDAKLNLLEIAANFSSISKNQIQITLGNSSVSSLSSAEFSVSSLSPNAAGYYSKIGPAGSTECSVSDGYDSNLVPLDNAQSVSLASVPDGPIKVCVIAQDVLGKKQSPSESSFATWVKDTIPPVATQITNAIYYYPSNTVSPTFTWTAFADDNGISKYQIAVGTTPLTQDILTWTDIGSVTSYQITNLNLAYSTVYYPSLRAIDSAGNISAPISNSGWYTLGDLTAPASLKDMNFGSLSQTPQMSWNAPSSFGAGIKRYELSIGTSPGLTDILGWTSVGNTTSYQVSGLSLTNGQMYYPSLRAIDNLDDVSAAINNDGFRAVNKWKNVEPTNPMYFLSTIKSVKLLGNGQRLVGGDFRNGNQFSPGYMLKLNSDGSRDTSHYPTTYIKFFTVQSDGKIVAISGAGADADEISRRNPDGTKDPLFESGSVFPQVGGTASFTLAQQPNGKIIIGGNFTTYKAVTQNRILRLNADGTFDGTFSIGTGFDNSVYAVASFADNKILAAGSFTSYNGTAASCVIKLNTNGSIDNTFTPPTFNTCPNKITLQPDGKAIVTGGFTTINGAANNRIARLNTDGTLDTSFTTGTGLNSSAYQTILQPDGKIIVGGNFTTYNSASAKYIVRLNSNGTVDNTFSVGTGFSGRVNNLGLLSNGKVVVGGTFGTYKGAASPYIAVLDSSGNLDTSFIGKFDYWVTDIFTTPDDKIITIALGSYVTDSVNGLARLNSDGTFDRSFNIGTGFSAPADASINSILIQPSDSKIIVGGKFTNFDGTTQNYITRLNSSGTRDASFNIGTGFNNIVNTVILQSDNKILAGGTFTAFAGTTTNRIARINSDGSLDSGFNTGTGFNNQVYSIALQSDGKIIVGGDFTTFNGISTPKIARLNTDGSLDTSFMVSTGFNSTVRALSVLDDQSILVGGAFTTYRGSATPYFTKLLNNGSKDTSFTAPSSLLNGKVASIAIQSDGKIVLGGSFSGADGRYLARLNENGSLDSTFITYSILEYIPTATVTSLDISSTGKILTGFEFSGWTQSAATEFEIPSHTMLFGW